MIALVAFGMGALTGCSRYTAVPVQLPPDAASGAAESDAVALKVGSEVRIVPKAGETVEGEIESYDPGVLVLMPYADLNTIETIEIDYDDIDRLELGSTNVVNTIAFAVLIAGALALGITYAAVSGLEDGLFD